MLSIVGSAASRMCFFSCDLRRMRRGPTLIGKHHQYWNVCGVKKNPRTSGCQTSSTTPLTKHAEPESARRNNSACKRKGTLKTRHSFQKGTRCTHDDKVEERIPTGPLRPQRPATLSSHYGMCTFCYPGLPFVSPVVVFFSFF